MPDINFPTIEISGLPPTSSLARSVQPPRAARDLGRPTNPRDQVSYFMLVYEGGMMIGVI